MSYNDRRGRKGTKIPKGLRDNSLVNSNVHHATKDSSTNGLERVPLRTCLKGPLYEWCCQSIGKALSSHITARIICESRAGERGIRVHDSNPKPQDAEREIDKSGEMHVGTEIQQFHMSVLQSRLFGGFGARITTPYLAMTPISSPLASFLSIVVVSAIPTQSKNVLRTSVRSVQIMKAI